MKRIANNVALQTILYTIKPNQKIKIIDVDGADTELIFDGEEQDFSTKLKYDKYCRSTVYNITVEDNHIVFFTETKYEQY